MATPSSSSENPLAIPVKAGMRAEIVAVRITKKRLDETTGELVDIGTIDVLLEPVPDGTD